jgi:hypothetical protein
LFDSPACSRQILRFAETDCDGDPRAAVNELIAIVGAVLEVNEALRDAASPGYARKPRPGKHR